MKIIDELIEGIKYYIDEKISKIPRDMSYYGRIVSVENGERYTVEINKVRYKNVSTIGGVCKINDIVLVLIPQNNYKNIVILK